jgi:hypothetical protein
MADTPIDPKDAERIKQSMDEIVRKTSELEYSFLRTRDASKALLESLAGSSEITDRIGRYGTQIKNAFIDISSLASRLGTDYIKVEQVEKRRLENQGMQIQLQTIQQNMIEDYNNNLNKVNKDGLAFKLKEVTLEESKAAILEKIKKDGLNSLDDQQKQFYVLTQYLQALKEQEEAIKGISNAVESGNKEFSKMAVKGTALKKIFDQLSFIPILSSFIRFDIVADKFLVSKKAGFKELGDQIKTIVTSPYFLAAAGILAIVAGVKALVKAAFEFDKQITQVSNNLGIAKEASIGILNNFRQISQNNQVYVEGLDRAFLSVKNQSVALAELQETLGTNAMLTNERIQSEIMMTKQMKLSKEESAGIQKLSLISGKSADDILQNAISQNKTAISYKKIISDISKVNSEISVMYKNNPDLIAKAVIQANKLGLSLEQTQQISKSLLDFETSIAGELEAELLTGKRLNFEKARALALDGKSVEAAQELLGQMGGLEGLTKLNVIQRDRLANSIGQSAEQLTTAAREQEVLNKLGFENRKALEEQYELLRSRNDQSGIAALMEEARKKEGGEVLLQDIARVNLQERFQETLERIKQVFTEIAAGPIIRIMEGIANMLQNTGVLKTVMVVLSTVMAAIAAAAIATAYAITVATGGANVLTASLAIGGGIGLMGGLGAIGAFGGGSSTETEERATRAAPSARTESLPPQTLATPETIPTNRLSNQDVSAVSNNSNSNNRNNRQDGSMASNDRNSAVIQNNILLQVDGIGLTIAQKKAVTSFA